MKHKKNYFIAILLILFSILGLKAQESTNASGGNAVGSGGSVSYSVGQTVYKTTTAAANGSVAQGVQQPYEISVVLSTQEASAISLLITAFPNPTNNYVTLNVANYDLTNLNYQIIDVNGRKLEKKKILINETIIDLEHFPQSIYFIHLLDNEKEVKTFKIIKN